MTQEKTLHKSQQRLDAHQLFFVIIDTGMRCNIKDVMADMALLRATQPTMFTSLFTTYNNLVAHAYHALQRSDIKKIGALMIENQQLLASLTLSPPEVDTIIQQALDLGACGAKLTGTGRGGLALALAPNEEIQQKLVHFFTQRGNYANAITLLQQPNMLFQKDHPFQRAFDVSPV